MQSSYETLIKKLNLFIREYYKNIILKGSIYALLGMFSVLILFATVEHFSFLSKEVRSLLFWSYCLSILLSISKFIILPAFKMFKLTTRLTHQQAAEIIGQHFEDVSDKLINILELKNIDAGSQELINASINQKIETIKLTPFNQAINWRATLNYAKYLIIPIVIFLLFFVSGNKEVISESTFRIIKYNTHFEKPAPFYFKIKNDSLLVVEKNAITIEVEIFGDELPQNVYVNYDARVKKMSQLSNTHFNYTFNGVEDDIKFYLSANNEYSQEYNIFVLGRPEIEEVVVSVTPPKHTGLNTTKYINAGSINVPQGSRLIWDIKASKTDTLQFKINNNTFKVTPSKDYHFKLDKKISTNSKYEISLANSNVSFIDTTFYDIKILSDAYPFISVSQTDGKTNTLPVIGGVIRDDYGFSSLTAYARIYGLNRDTLVKTSIAIDVQARSQSFISPINGSNVDFKAGEIIDFYFIVRDNDAPSKYKETISETITFNAPTINELQKKYDEQNQFIKNNMSSEIAMLKALEKELTDFEKELIDKDSLDWRDRKKLENILNKQASLEEKIDELKQSSKSNFEQLNSISPPTPEILKKQQALEKLFDEIIPEEMKELYEELNALKDLMSKDDLQKKLQELQLSNEDLEKELDRNLEILKQLEFDQKLENIIDRLNALKQSQLALSEEEKEKTLEKLKKQQEHIEEFQKIQKEILNMKDLNNKLENKKSLSKSTELEGEISDELTKGKDDLEKNRKNRASKSQKEAGKKLEKLANLFKKMQAEDKEAQQYEDMDVLRQILENLVYFSIEEENILLEFQELDKNDPQYVELMHKQQALRDAAVVIEDSLFALSKRAPQVSSKINREINAIDKKTGSAIDHLRERQTLKAVQDQQFIMTSANNLAVLLSSILEQMQEDLASDLPSTQQCEKPGKGGTPKPGDLKKMQQQLSEHLEQMKQELQKGNTNNMGQNGMSKKLVEMLAKQELIRESLKELRGELNDEKGLNSLENAINNMEKNEEDIANKKLTLESLNRQKEILTRLLEVENSLREQGEDEERESKTSMKEYEKIIQDAYEKYELEKLKQTELLKTMPPQLTKYYKEKVDRYFNLMLQ